MATSNPILRASKVLDESVMELFRECVMPYFPDFSTYPLFTHKPTHLSEFMFLMQNKTLVPHSKVELSENLYKDSNKPVKNADGKGRLYLHAQPGKLGFKSARTEGRVAISAFLKQLSVEKRSQVTAKFSTACFCTGGVYATFGRQLKFLVNKEDIVVSPIMEMEAYVSCYGAGLSYVMDNKLKRKDLVGENGIRFNRHASLGSPFMVNGLDAANLNECLSLTQSLEKEIKDFKGSALEWYNKIIDNIGPESRTQLLACVSSCKDDFCTEIKAKGRELREYVVSPKCITNIISQSGQAIGDATLNVVDDWLSSDDKLYIKKSFSMKGFNMTGDGASRLCSVFEKQLNFRPDHDDTYKRIRWSKEDFEGFPLCNQYTPGSSGSINFLQRKIMTAFTLANGEVKDFLPTSFAFAKAHSGDDSHVFVKVGNQLIGFASDFSSFDMTQNDKCTRACKDSLRTVIATIDPIAADLWYGFNTRRLVVKESTQTFLTADGAPSGISMISLLNDMVCDVFLNRVKVNFDYYLPHIPFDVAPYTGYETDLKTFLEAVVSVVAKEMGFICKMDQYHLYADVGDDVNMVDVIRQKSFVFVGQHIYFNEAEKAIRTECDVPRFMAQMRYGRAPYMKVGAYYDVMTAISLMGALLSVGFMREQEAFGAFHKSIVANAETVYAKHSYYINTSLGDLEEIRNAMEIGDFTFFPMLNADPSYKGLLKFVSNKDNLLNLYRPKQDEVETIVPNSDLAIPTFSKVSVKPSKTAHVEESRVTIKNFNKRVPSTLARVVALRRVMLYKPLKGPKISKSSKKGDNYEVNDFEQDDDNDTVNSEGSRYSTTRSDASAAFEREEQYRIRVMKEEDKAQGDRLSGYASSWTG